ncbi:MAG: MerR family transcriptional regulator [Chitinophagaceae bacterium]|jgi:DNA-binding transcriptional MerR regulator
MQLDLFGNPISPPISSSPKEKKKVVFANNQVTVKIKEEKPIADLEQIIEPKQLIKRSEVTVKESPKQEINNTISTSTLSTINKGKRGRKSYAETYATVDEIDVPDDAELKNKLYYSISEVALWFKVTNSQIRFWENEFDILKPRKNRKGDRLFRVEDIQNLKVIYYLLRNRKFSIEGAKEYLKSNKHKTNTHLQLKDTLTKFKSFLLEIKANLEK